MRNGDDSRIGLKNLIAPELTAYMQRIEKLERTHAARGKFVEAMDLTWFSDLEARIMAEPDREMAEIHLAHANTMSALMLHRRLSNLERDLDGDAENI